VRANPEKVQAEGKEKENRERVERDTNKPLLNDR
jgi:hypothetical protein